MSKTFFIADIHGEIKHLGKLLEILQLNGMDLTVDTLIQLGDKNDRGRDTFAVFQEFIDLKNTYPDNVICLLGNHERMMIDAAMNPRDKGDLFLMNGGAQTVTSYMRHFKKYANYRFGLNVFKPMLDDCGHWEFLKEHLLFLEDEGENPFFASHAPVPLPAYRDWFGGEYGYSNGPDFRVNERILTWSYNDQVPMDKWIDTDLEEKHRPCVSGHLHGMEYNSSTGKIFIPGVRKYGHAVILDTGCGCSESGYLSALELPTMKVYDSRGEIFSLVEGTKK